VTVAVYFLFIVVVL